MKYLKEFSVFDNIPDESPVLTIELDTIADVRDGRLVAGLENDSGYLINVIEENDIKYTILDEAGPGPAGGWPIIEYTGTKEQLIPLFLLFDGYSRDENELREILAEWDGTTDHLTELIF